jgi:surface polysaccharide O-acyltransferase-like enzyme
MVVSCCDWGTPESQLLPTRRGSNRTAQGILGSFLIKLNIAAAVYRRNSILHEWPILEVMGAAAITAAVSYLVSATLFVVLCTPEADISIGCFP